MNQSDQGDEPALVPALEFQAAILDDVSRTFALTIPSLPEPLRIPVTNAYLLCRIADTIEDDVALDLSQKRDFAARFVAVLDGDVRPETFSGALAARLGPTTLDAERELVARTGEVVRITHSFSPAQRTALIRCVRLMSAGMHRFQQGAGRQGLATMRDMDEYCYYVAGVVGEMLTELFCDHSPTIERNRDELMRLAPSFGQGLQMTNILKDIWDDRERGICWLPRHEFGKRENGSDDLVGSLDREAFGAGLERLVVIAHGHLRNALEYTLLIPGEFRGIRRFCLWALGMAVPTLRNIYCNTGFRSGDEVKIRRRDVRRIVRRYGLFAGNDAVVRWLFARASHGLPESDPGVGDRLDEISRRAGMRLAEAPGESKQRSVTVT